MRFLLPHSEGPGASCLNACGKPYPPRGRPLKTNGRPLADRQMTWPFLTVRCGALLSALRGRPRKTPQGRPPGKTCHGRAPPPATGLPREGREACRGLPRRVGKTSLDAPRASPGEDLFPGSARVFRKPPRSSPSATVFRGLPRSSPSATVFPRVREASQVFPVCHSLPTPPQVFPVCHSLPACSGSFQGLPAYPRSSPSATVFGRLPRSSPSATVFR